MTKREQMHNEFERYCVIRNRDIERDRHGYVDDFTQLDWHIWQAAYSAALDAAAQECDRRAIGPTTADEWTMAIDCARAIRKMRDETHDHHHLLPDARLP